MKSLKQLLLTASLLIITGSAFADWDPGDPSKWVQYPDLQNGMDVKATFPKILADDFLCTFSGPITDVHLWGSWLNDIVSTSVAFKLSFHSDIPKGPTTPYSRPGPELWSMTFGPGQYTPRIYATGHEVFYDPNQGTIIGSDTNVWQYNFLIPEAVAFRQQVGNIYWLDVQAIGVPAPLQFGWKTSTNHFNDDAVWGDTTIPGGPALFWEELHSPLTGESLDLAFVLTTVPEPSTFSVIMLGGGLLMVLRRRQVKQS